MYYVHEVSRTMYIVKLTMCKYNELLYISIYNKVSCVHSTFNYIHIIFNYITNSHPVSNYISLCV